MQKYIFMLLLVISFSCKEDGKKQVDLESVIEVVEENPPQLQVVINAVVLEDDIFEVYYYEEGQDGFDSKDRVFTRIKGNASAQDIMFDLPENLFPERLRLDFGKSTNQKEIKLNSVKMLFGEKDYTFSNDELVNQFKPSKFIEFDKENMIIKTKKIDGKYDPYFYTKKVNNIVDYLLED